MNTLRRLAEAWWWGCSQRLLKKLFIVLLSGIGAVWLYWWEVKYQMSCLPVDIPYTYAIQPFILHLLLFTFLLAATLADFHERITVLITAVGTFVALLVAGSFLLPLSGLTVSHRVEIRDGLYDSGCSYTLVPLDVWSPNEPPQGGTVRQWTKSYIVAVFRTKSPHLKWVSDLGIYSLITMTLLWWFWCFAMLDRVWYTKLPIRKANAIFWRYLYRSLKTKYIVAAALLGPFFFEPLVSDWRDETALLSALVGMATGMILVWSTRLVLRWCLGIDVMRFGDVVLMGMIGAFLGWQAVLLIFVAALFSGLISGVINRLLGRNRVVPYGPFLCLATVAVVIFWPFIWQATAAYFSCGMGVIGYLFFLGVGVIRHLFSLLKL